jgi:hypothetical protein
MYQWYHRNDQRTEQRPPRNKIQDQVGGQNYSEWGGVEKYEPSRHFALKSEVKR